MRRAGTTQGQTKKRIKTRCRACKMNQAKRICKALQNMAICPTCCREMRNKIPNCDRVCRYFSPLITTSRILPLQELPLYKCQISQSRNTGMLNIAVAREKPNGYLQAMFILVDLWKKGLRNCFVDSHISKEHFEKRCHKIAREFPFEDIDFDECRRIIKHAHRITTEIGEESPWEYTYWEHILGDMSQVPDLGGSLYKCAKCGDDLPERTVGLMKQHAKTEDIQFYILCRQCGGQAEF